MSTDASFEHPSFPKPPQGSKLWRYMPWQRFDWLANERRLFMSSLPILDDKFEGKTPKLVVESMTAALSEAKTDDERTNIANIIDQLRRFAETFYHHHYVSCWHFNDAESATMWGAYTQTAESMVIRTTCEALRAELPSSIDIGLVRYIDYDTQGFAGSNIFEWVMNKRRHYTGEREVRAVACTLTPDQLGGRVLRDNLFEISTRPGAEAILLPIEPVRLIDAIYLHPRATPDFAAEAARFCDAKGLPTPLSSELSAAGTF